MIADFADLAKQLIHLFIEQPIQLNLAPTFNLKELDLRKAISCAGICDIVLDPSTY